MNAIPPDDHRCEATRTTSYYSDTPGKPKRCAFLAKYRVGDKRLCDRHAGLASLEFALEAGGASKIRRFG